MPSIVRKPRASTASGGNPASLAGRREDVEHLSRNSDSPGKKQSAIAATLDDLNVGGDICRDDKAYRKRPADQLDEDTAQDDNASAKKPSVESAADGASRPRKKKAKPAPAAPAPQAVDWCVQRIVRDLGRLDVLRRGDVGPDVVSDDEDEKALDILVRKLVEEAVEDGDMAPPADGHDNDDYDNIGGGGDGGDYGDAAMVFGDGHLDDEFIPAAPEHFYGEDGNSVAVVTHDDDYNGDDMAITADASTADGAEVTDRVSAKDEGYSEETAEKPSSEVVANIQVPTAAATSGDVELSPTDVNYNHGARNPLNDPTAQAVYQPGDDDVFAPKRCLIYRQLEWFEATNKDVADRKGRKNAPAVLGQVGFRCVHCAHIPFTKRTVGAVSYPSNCTTSMRNALNSYQSRHFMECKEIPTAIKSHSKNLSSRQVKRGQLHTAHVMNGFKNIGIIEKDGRLVYDKGSTSVVDERRDVIGSDGTEEGYWLCDKCQSVKFANFEEACTHEETCRGTAAKPTFDALDRSDCLLPKPDKLRRPDFTNEGEGAYVLSLCCECKKLEDPVSDVPMLLCDGCDSATHLTCTKDVPKLTEVPDGEWFCSICALGNTFKEKRLSEDRAITTAFNAVGEVRGDNFCIVPGVGKRLRPSPRLGKTLDDIFGESPGIQCKYQPNLSGGRRVRCCVVIGCTRNAQKGKYRYMCRAHCNRALLLEKIQTMSNGERRFPCTARDPSLPRDHESAYVAVPPNAKHGARVKCSNSVCRTSGKGNFTHKYCLVCDNIVEKKTFNKGHKHENELGLLLRLEDQNNQARVDAALQAAKETTDKVFARWKCDSCKLIIPFGTKPCDCGARRRRLCAIPDCTRPSIGSQYGILCDYHYRRSTPNNSEETPPPHDAEDSEIVYGFDSIRGHIKDRKKKGEYLFRVKWKNGEITSEPDTFLKEDDPATFAEYLKRSGLSKTKKYAWANEEEDV